MLMIRGHASCQTAFSEILALTISGKSLNLSESDVSAINGSNYYLYELLGGLKMTSGKCLINDCFYYGGLLPRLAPARDPTIREVTTSNT